VSDSANVELVRSIYADLERGDFSSVEGADPEIEYVLADGPEPGPWTGLAQMAGTMRDLLNAWEEWRVQADDYRELDDEQVLVLDHRSGRGKTSGLELSQIRSQGAHLFHIRDGKVTRLVRYLNRDRALADLGLAPQGDAS
jgi:ketosteroid isomerase-like protein